MGVEDLDDVIGHRVPRITEGVGEPAMGEIWRLRWDQAVVLAIVGQVRPHDVDAYAIVELDQPEPGTLRIDHDETGLGVLDVVARHVVAVSRAVLDARLATTSLGAALEAITPAPPRPWEHEPEELIEAVEELEEFGQIAWAGSVDPQEVPAASREDLFDQLVDIGIPVNRALAISSRSAPPTDEEADLIERMIGRRPPAPSVAPTLQIAIDRPRRKRAILRRAAAAGVSEGAIRLDLARDADPALVAARGTRGAPPDYDLVVDRLLEDDA